ncbi:MAG: UvrD-helicase domain-containing protein, partial [Chloroflexi bacterium]|nr:UvrD-helicase domain-containing protein [Chloroflexota bacterium]
MILVGLNKQQREAVTAGRGPVLVLAGPGSGKTRVLTHRIAYLIEEVGVPAWRILAVTFTNKAAREMEHRVVGLLEDSGKFDGLTIGTFHAICARTLRVEADYTDFTRDYVIFDTNDQLAVMKQALADLNLDAKKNSPRSMLSQVSAAKNELITAEEYPANDYRSEILRRVYLRYNELLRTNNARDFDDLLMHTVELFQEHADVLTRYQRRYEWALVDEFQDTNMAQYTLVKQLAGGEQRNLFAVGDPDQSIYAFRGADHRNVERFREDFPDTQLILLEENYRSHQGILNAAMGVIDQNPNRVRKELFSRRKEGPLLHIKEAYDEDDEAQFVVDTIAELVALGEFNPGDFAVMYRVNAQSRALEDGFLRAGLPYRLIGATRFYARREVKDAMAYLRLIHNPDDNVSLNRVINVPPRGIGQKTLGGLETWAESLGVPMPQALMLLLDENTDAPFASRARKALASFAALLRDWRRERSELSPGDMLSKVLEDTSYLNYLDDGTDEGRSRAENVLELLTVAGGYEGMDLTTFLEEVSLVSDVDTRDEETQAPSLLTLHAAKGLEFPVVFITGLEEGVLPHSRSLDDPDQMQEERRLMYVGLTRAEYRVYLVYTFRRALYGDSSANMPSRFLYDIPAEVREGQPLSKPGAAAVERDAYRRM